MENLSVSSDKKPNQEPALTKEKIGTFDGRRISPSTTSDQKSMPLPRGEKLEQHNKRFSITESALNLAGRGFRFFIKQGIFAITSPHLDYYKEQKNRFNDLVRENPEWAEAMDEIQQRIMTMISDGVSQKEYKGLLDQFKKVISENPELLLPTIECLTKDILSNLAIMEIKLNLSRDYQKRNF